MKYPLQSLYTLPKRMIYHVQIRGGSKMGNGAWDMMVSAAWYLRAQWIIIGLLCIALIGMGAT